MTAHVHTTIRCGRPSCTAAFDGDGWPGDVRKRAEKDAGWDTDGTDRCPAHLDEGPPPPSLLDLLR